MSSAPPPSTTAPVNARPPAAAPAPRVGDLLLQRGDVTAEQIDQALAYQKSRGHRKLLGEVLVELDFVTEAQVMAALAEAYGVPFADLDPALVDPKVVALLDRELLEKHHVLPLFLVRGRLTVAMAEPTNVFAIEEVERLTGHTVQVVAATAANLEATRRAVTPDDNVFVIDEMNEVGDTDLAVVEKEITDLSDLEGSASESPVIKLVNYIIYAAVKDGASDIHVEPDDGKLRVRYRVDGRLFEKLTPPSRMLAAVVSRVKIMAGLDISERRVPQDGGITIVIDKRQIDLRVSTCPGKFGEKVVIRIIDTRNAMTGLDKLGFGYDMLRRFRETIHQPNGVFLVTGPTGSGKSTSLYAALNEINDEA
ncbi:MAG: ATPase, T2SS/T4P/T4SS family, partial [Planctomycetota bacterium]